MTLVFIGQNFGLTGEPVTVNVTLESKPVSALLFSDFDAQIQVQTASTSRLLFTLKRCPPKLTPDLELDSESGLTIVSGSTPDSMDGVLSWDSESQVSVHIAARALGLRPVAYQWDLTEITLAGRTLKPIRGVIHFVMPAGREMA